ncbi:hypothetical protein WAF17_09575 [Bernardetia sp. ABR2-2B]|uniref:hypothetical protein n=1 Tax=Bernardetia sp. ABR2-2B TaxID=3127472 RepID=UPI0030D4FEE7
MKKQITFLLTTLCILMSSCSKEEVRLNRNYWGEVQVLKNGETWKPFIYATTDVKNSEVIYVEMGYYSKQGISKEVLTLSQISKRIGFNSIISDKVGTDIQDENNIINYSSYYSLIADGDVICSSYQVDDSVEVAGYVNVTKYDAESGILEGTFEVTLVKDRSCEENAPDTLRFTEGVFYTRVQED